MCWFDEAKCADGLQSLRHYKFEYDQEKNRWGESPAHDWASHGADAFMAIGGNIRTKTQSKNAGFSNIDRRSKPHTSSGYHEVYA
jgi:phage terminase large subunit